MDFPPLEVMMFRDKILTLRKLEVEQLYESLLRFKGILIQCLTYEIPDIVFKEYFNMISWYKN